MKKAVITLLVGILVALSFVWLATRPAKPRPFLVALPAIKAHLAEHPELGIADYARDQPDWSLGQRQRVFFEDGRSFLFYEKKGVIVALYQDQPDGSRKLFWGSPE